MNSSLMCLIHPASPQQQQRLKLRTACQNRGGLRLNGPGWQQRVSLHLELLMRPPEEEEKKKIPPTTRRLCPSTMACGAHLTGAELNGEGVRGCLVQAERRSITVAVKCRVAAVTTCCINSGCCDRMGFFSFSIRRLKYNINLPVLLPSALCNCLALLSLLMDFLSNPSSRSISEKQPSL